MAENKEKLPQPGSIQVEEISISSQNGKQVDISQIIKEMNIYESLAQPFMTANLIIEDATSLFTYLPIVGEETISIKFKVSEGDEWKPFEKTFRIISIRDITPTERVRNVRYNLRLIAPEAFNDWTTRIRKSYSESLVSDMIKKITKDYLKIEENQSNTPTEINGVAQAVPLNEKKATNKITVSNSDGKRTIVIPNMHPTEAIKFLSQEAKSEKYKPSNFVFFSNAKGYFWQTVEEIIESSLKKTIDKYLVVEKNYNNITDLNKTDANKNEKPIEFMKINSYRFVNIFNFEDNLRRGSFDVTNYWIDPVMQRYGKEVYNYQKDYDKFKRIDKESNKYTLNDSSFKDLKGDSKWVYTITDKEHNKETPDEKYSFLHYLFASVSMLDYVSLEVSIPGDSGRTVGDIIEIKFPEYSAFDNTISELNNHLAGNYLIVALRHFYNPDNVTGYSVVMQCVKNDYFKKPNTKFSGNLNLNSITKLA